MARTVCRTPQRSKAGDVLDISSSSPDPYPIPIPPPPNAEPPPRSRAAAKRASAVNASSTTNAAAGTKDPLPNGTRERLRHKQEPFTLASPPPSPPTAGPSRRSKSVPKPRPRPVPKSKALKTGPTLAVIEITDSSDGEVEIVLRTATRNANATRTEGELREEKGKGKGKGAEDLLDGKTREPSTAVVAQHDAGWDDFYASDEDAQTTPPPAAAHQHAAPPGGYLPPKINPQRLPRENRIPHLRHSLADSDFEPDDYEFGLPRIEPLPFPLSTASASDGKDDKSTERRELTQEPTPPSQNPTPPRRPSPHDAGPSNTNRHANADGTLDVDAWRYDVGNLDEEQLQAIAIAADADEESQARDPFGGAGGREVAKVGVGGPGEEQKQSDWRGGERGRGKDTSSLLDRGPLAHDHDNAMDVDIDHDAQPHLYPVSRFASQPLDEPLEIFDSEPPQPEIPPDPVTIAVAAVLEMIPDIEPDHLLALVETHLPTYGANQIVEFLVSHLFENPDYPRAERGNGKGKEKTVEGTSAGAKRKAGGEAEGGEGKKPKIDFASAERPNDGGEQYRECATAALQTAFPHIPLPYLRKKLASKKGLYAPTHLEIIDEEARGVKLYKPKKGSYFRAGKWKGKAASDPVFEEEKRWLDVFLESGGGVDPRASTPGANADPQGDQKADVDEGDDDEGEDLEDDGTFVECGCCFSTYPFDRMTQCPDTHLFCRSCLRRYAANELGSQNCMLKCMHTSGCTSLFAVSELRRLLPTKLFALYDRLKQQKELKEANLEGLEECPFCDWACVIEASKEEDRLFRCGNEEECGVVSCRLCRKKEHVPKTCQEAEEDKHLGGRVAIEEAMTAALKRKCPKCEKEFIKSDGCNKMTCPNCRTLMCYVCKQAIKGYEHFHPNDPHQPGSSSANSKCPLWDSVDHRHDQEVKEAYQKALEDYKRDHPDIEVGKDFKIDLPKSPPKQANTLPAGYIDPNALAAGGGGHVGGYMPLPPIPNHLRVDALERALGDANNALDRARRTLQTATTQFHNAQRAEKDLQNLVFGADAGAGVSGKTRRRGVPSGHYTPAAVAGFRQQLSKASVNRAAVEIRFENAEREVERLQANLAALREQLRHRQDALEQWRREQQQLNAQQNVAAEEGMLARLGRRMQEQAERARALMEDAIRAQRERMLANERQRQAQALPAAVAPRRRQPRKKKR